MNDNQNREKLNMQEQETITIRNLATGYKGKHKTHIVARDIMPVFMLANSLVCLEPMERGSPLCCIHCPVSYRNCRERSGS